MQQQEHDPNRQEENSSSDASYENPMASYEYEREKIQEPRETSYQEGYRRQEFVPSVPKEQTSNKKKKRKKKNKKKQQQITLNLPDKLIKFGTALVLLGAVILFSYLFLPSMLDLIVQIASLVFMIFQIYLWRGLFILLEKVFDWIDDLMNWLDDLF